MSNIFGIKPYKNDDMYWLYDISEYMKLIHPYARENNPNKFDYMWAWVRFRDEYNFIEKVVNKSGLREMLEQIKR